MPMIRRDVMAEIPNGCAQAVFYEEHESAEKMLDIAREGEIKLIIKRIESVPLLSRLLREWLHSLAEIALFYWPNWYNTSLNSSLDRSLSSEAFYKNLVSKNPVPHSARPILKRWFLKAAQLCQSSKAPLPSGFGQEVQFSQLSLAIAPIRLAMAFYVVDEQAKRERIEGLAKAATWAAENSNARIAVIVPAAWEQWTELDAVRRGSISLAADKPKNILNRLEQAENRGELVPPLDGAPHPASRGEQLLANKLHRDAELDGLFVFNTPVATIRESRPRVDLLWPEGRVVVEVDGYQYHSDRWRFSADRNRDYELIISGYLVLRLPHDEVVADPELSLEKIRDIVRFRRGQMRG